AVLFNFVQQNPGLPLGFLGMPGCFQYVGLTGAISNVYVVSGNSNNTNFLIPNLPQFNGTLVFGQSATFSSGFNPLGVSSSNGVRMRVGSLGAEPLRCGEHTDGRGRHLPVAAVAFQGRNFSGFFSLRGRYSSIT